MVEAMRYVLPKAFLRANLVAAYGNPAALNDALLQRYYDMMLAPGARGAMIERLRQTIITPPEAVLRRIRAPTLILWGTKDALIPVTNAADYHRNIAGSTLVELPGLGHVPQEEAPAVSIRPLEAFLARENRPGGNRPAAGSGCRQKIAQHGCGIDGIQQQCDHHE